MKTDNELIAEFMGMIFKRDVSTHPDGIYMLTDGSGGYFIEDLKYSTSWDWLMPVVEKIESVRGLRKWNSKGNLLRVEVEQSLIDFSVVPEVRKSKVHHSVIEFIKWYNQQSK